MAFSPRFAKSIYQALDTMIENLPGRKRYVICCLASSYDAFKRLPESYFRGRWLYIDYKGTTTFIKKVIIERPTGCWEHVKFKTKENKDE